MASLKEYRDEQIVKLNQLKDLGVDPYPSASKADTSIADIVADKDSYLTKQATVAGRVLSIRQHGKLSFIDLSSDQAQMQLVIRKDDLTADYPQGQLGFDEVSLLTRGDFIEAHGTIDLSRTGQLSLMTQTLRILTKVIRPLPEDLDDKETRLRQRYLDMAINDDVTARFIRRSKFWQATRDFLNDKGFYEVNTPVLEHTTGGADANPFVTHMDALDQDFYMRISHELPLKRLLGGGLSKVYDIGPRFRNENYSDEHLPEHIAMEWYWAYANWEQGMELMEDLFKQIALKTYGTTEFTFTDTKGGSHQINLDQPWQRWSYPDVIKEHYGLDIFDCSVEDAAAKLKDNGLEVEKADNLPRIIDKLWKKIRADVAGPVWLIDTPKFISPLSKAKTDDPRLTERFQAVFFGSELSNGYSELNDPQDQLERFVEQQQMRDAGDDEAQMLDIDFVEMLEYGMPPACGLGFSERVFWIMEGVTAREGVPFPQLRQEVSEATKSVYPQVYGPDGFIKN